MTQETAIKLFESRQVRTAWSEEQEEWYFSVADVVGVLTDSINPTDYLIKSSKQNLKNLDKIKVQTINK